MLFAALLFATTTVAPTDPGIYYVGRWDLTEAAAPACQWPACEVRFRIDGPDSVTASFDESGKDFWQVVVDDKRTQVLALQPGVHDYPIDMPTDGPNGRPIVHWVRFVKRTEAFVGTTKFRGVTIGGNILKGDLPMAKRHLEFVGDSITCGYGNEGANQNEHFKPETENAYMSYASVAAREVKADVSIIAWSGKKMWPDNTMPALYDRILPTQEKPLYDFKGPKPAAVIINLATNDFGAGNPDESMWTGAYEAFIKRVWSHYPKALVYCTTGSMMSDGYPAKQQALTTLTTYLKDMIARLNDPRLHFFAFDTQKMEDGFGADWHPNLKTDGIMGDKLAGQLRTDLGW